MGPHTGLGTSLWGHHCVVGHFLVAHNAKVLYFQKLAVFNHDFNSIDKKTTSDIFSEVCEFQQYLGYFV
jgi:hypothetical protein